MEFDDVIAGRWSCRAFLPDPIADDVLNEVLTLAQRTASWCNVQAWESWLVTGAALESLRRGLRAYASAHADAASWIPDLTLPIAYRGDYLARRREAGYGLYAAMGIERSDHDARRAALLRNFEFFSAPAVLVVTTDPELGAYGAVDCGGYVTNVMNAAVSRGLGAVAQGALAQYAVEVRRLVGIPAERALVCGVALGYPDGADPVNRFRTDRADVDRSVVRVTRAVGS